MAGSRAYNVYCFLTVLLCMLGMGLSIYACYVEVHKEKDKSYKALCDLSEFMSCSKVFTSIYGKGFGLIGRIIGHDHWLNLPNSIFGLAFYTMQVTLVINHTVTASTVMMIVAILANLGSVYLGYILYFILEDFCVVCVSTYVVNFLLLVVTMLRRNILKQKLDLKRK